MGFNHKCPFHTFVAGALACAVLTYIVRGTKEKKAPIIRHDLRMEGKRVTTCEVGQMVFICGQLADGKTIEEQAAGCLAGVDKALAMAGTDKSNILECTIWIKDMADYAGFNRVYDQWVVPGMCPARACTKAELFSPEKLVEVRVIAAKQ
jgi:enamine deaminase RidA (YjgF/YER057c/UK114 family)